MPTLNQYPTAIQQAPNSCWAAAARSITNWYQSLGQSGPWPVFASDQDIATAWSTVTQDPNNADINQQQSAAAALGDLSFGNSMDSAALPTAAEITDAINIGMPLLSLVGAQAPDPNPDPQAQQGHWVVIVGISDDENNLFVFDPASGQIGQVPYDPQTYTDGLYWQNTSYVDPYYAALPADPPSATPSTTPTTGGSQ